MKPENFFLLLGTLFGFLFIFVTPPALVGDEPNHFFRAYQITEGNILGEKRGDLSGGFIPKSVLYTNRVLVGNIEMNHDVKFDTKLISELIHLPLNRNEQVFERFPNTVVYNPVPYFPQIIAISVGKIFDASPLLLIYFARIINLLFFLALAYFAIKITPIHKWVFCLLCLTPTNIFQVASASADAFTYGICFFTIAYFLRAAMENENIAVSKKEILKIFIFSLAAVLCKQAYILLPLLFLLIPLKKFGSIRAYFFTFFALMAVCAGAVAAWASIVKPIYLPYRIDIPIDPEQQLKYILTAPFNFIFLALKDYFYQFGYYFITFSGQLTWFDLYVPTWLTIFVFAILMLVAVLDKDTRFDVPQFGKIIFLFILICTAFIISALLYMTWSPVGGDIIQGIQGRYFIPVAPLFFLLFYNKKVKWKFFKGYVHIILYVSVVISMFVTLYSVIERYYV
ncbi:MAG TPA: DUF2142 domain-containing protein [Pyrinomonadaceae bacterium]